MFRKSLGTHPRAGPARAFQDCRAGAGSLCARIAFLEMTHSALNSGNQNSSGELLLFACNCKSWKHTYVFCAYHGAIPQEESEKRILKFFRNQRRSGIAKGTLGYKGWDFMSVSAPWCSQELGFILRV